MVVEPIWIRRGRCPACRRSHALLPDLLLVRCLDAVAVIGQGLHWKVLAGLGVRHVADQLDVPHMTVRSWWRRFRACAPTLLASCTSFAVSLDGTSVSVDVRSPDRAALETLPIAWNRARARFDERIGGMWSLWSRISGGQALGAHELTLGSGWGTDWMQPSVLGGPAP